MQKYSIKKVGFALLLTLAGAADLSTFAAEPDHLSYDDKTVDDKSAFTGFELTASPAPFVTSEAAAQLEDRIARLETELQALRQPAVQEHVTVTNLFSDEPESSKGRLYGSVEMTFLRPRVSGVIGAFSPHNGGRLLANNFDTGIRYVLGYRGENGLGFRGRYWSFNDSYAFQPPYGPANMMIDTQAADMEVTLLQTHRTWDVELSSGIRYGKLRYFSDTPGAFGVGEAYFEGIGPTMAGNIQRPLGSSGFSLFGNLRGSLLFGEIRNASMLLNLPNGPVRDEVATTIENQLGVAWTAEIGQSAQFELRTAWETQYWMSETLSDDTFGISSNLGFMGPTIAAELRY